ncbi:hypothetical protein PGQ11_002636 [Apiospora arundinis]|uniref:Uncharacterized protein n=1 Tax=Apiospora arundinis TaxID=335852 RepID=A0ABR2JKX2_9PEZI
MQFFNNPMACIVALGLALGAAIAAPAVPAGGPIDCEKPVVTYSINDCMARCGSMCRRKPAPLKGIPPAWGCC